MVRDYECVVNSFVNDIWLDGANNGRSIGYYKILAHTNWNRIWVNVSTHVQAHEIDRCTSRQQAEISNLTPWSSYEFSVAAVKDLDIGTRFTPAPIYSTHEGRLIYIAPKNEGGGGSKIGDLTVIWDSLLLKQNSSDVNTYK